MTASLVATRARDLAVPASAEAPAERWTRRRARPRVGPAHHERAHVLFGHLERCAAGDTDPIDTRAAHYAGCHAGRAAACVERQPQAAHLSKLLPLHPDPAVRDRIHGDGPVRTPRHVLPHLSVRRLRGDAVAAHALVGPARYAPGPRLSENHGRRPGRRAARSPCCHRRPHWPKGGWQGRCGRFRRRRSRTSRR